MNTVFEWEPTGPNEDPEERLRAMPIEEPWVPSLVINGVLLHVEAYRIKQDTDAQEGDGDWAVENLNALATIYEATHDLHPGLPQVWPHDRDAPPAPERRRAPGVASLREDQEV